MKALVMDDKEVIARSLPPPVDVPVDGHFAGKLTADLRAELDGWAFLSLAALGLAGLLALLLALARVPGAEMIFPWTGETFFRKLLVVHVSFAFVVWYLGVQGAMTVVVTAQAAAERNVRLGGLATLTGRVSVYGFGISFLMLLVPALADLGEPSINNYVPLLVHPLYFAGLTLLAVCVALPILRLLIFLSKQRFGEAGTFGVACAGVIYLLAMACIALAWFTLPPNTGLEGAAEYVMWGGGHILQFANTALMLCGFYLLLRVTLGETPMPAPWFKGMMLLLVAGAAAGPLLYLTYEGGSPSMRMTFTHLYWYALPLPAAVVMFSVIALLVRRKQDLLTGAPEVKAVAAALVLFAVGGVFGFFEGSVDTRTPSHYHAMLIAVTLGFMALYFGLFLPLLHRRTERRRLRTSMYLLLGGGQLIHSLGLFVAGMEGVARKTAGAAQDIDTATKFTFLAVQGLGGIIAVAGGIIFIFLAGRLLLAKSAHDVTAGPDNGAANLGEK
jgi:cytochrome c oxidase subunit 1